MDWRPPSCASDRGLSPVVGTAILLVIVVLLAGLIGALVTGVGLPSSDPTGPVVGLTYDNTDDQLRLHHEGGETLRQGTLIIRNQSTVLVNVDPTGLRPGETLTRNVSSAALQHSDHIEVIWDPAGADTTKTVVVSTTPNELDVESDASPPAHHNETIYAVDPSANARTTHVVNARIESGNPAVGDLLDGVIIKYDQTDVSSVSNDSGDIQKIGVDTDGDGTIEKHYLTNISSTSTLNDGHTLRIDVDEFETDYRLEVDDRVIVRYDDVQNPSAGTYSVEITPDYEEGNPTATGELEIENS